MTTIRRAAVLGAGVMGAQVAAHLANAGIPSYLLDIVPRDLPEGGRRSTLAEEALRRLGKMSPAPLMHARNARMITPGNLEDDLGRIAEVDWVIEAVVERLDVKQDLWKRVGAVARPGTILSSNTSGLSIAAQAEALPEEHRRSFLGTHFFNPPRYLKLLEIIPAPETGPEVVKKIEEFATRVLGKGVVRANDTPNFIANRIGTYGLMVTLRVMEELGLGVDEVDALTGPVSGRPKSATFRTLDVVGLDTFMHVIRNAAATTGDSEEREWLAIPAYLDTMLERGWTGEKAGQGFFKKIKGEGGESLILSLDLNTLEYGERKKARWASLEQVRNVKDTGERVRALANAKDVAGQFVWKTLSRVLAFCADKAHEIANGDVGAIDRAMRWGFNWEMGPFETWNALGVRETIERMEADGLRVPGWVREIERFPVDRQGESPLSFAAIRSEPTRIVKATPGATLVDLGDEVLGLEFHSPKQAIGQDYVVVARAAAEEVRRNWRGLVVGASAPNFCVGANLMIVLMEAQEGNWDELDRAAREFQDVNMLLKYLERPVVVAPYAVTVGGGVEVAMHCARTVAAAETYMGFVEPGVGIIPAAGGTKEMALRAAAMMPQGDTQLPDRPELIGFVGRAFEAIATAKVSTSAAEARDMGYLRPTDSIVMNGDMLLDDAKQAVLEMDRAGYVPALPADIPVAGLDGRAVLEFAAYMLKNGGYATEHDVLIANKLAYVLTGGDLPAGTPVPEQYLLDLEREAFLHLAGHPKSQARMVHMLQKNKPLRN
jgi:3-hydroxyacyl-CoA dehydrogenase